ncbi:TonB-dependent receptor, partial [Mycolicibacterium sp.]|uniref:TonB-dependent receptor n=1 Tax=Mycolicibacterium sp. TaxID=2320850 RepID=UPI00355E77B6
YGKQGQGSRHSSRLLAGVASTLMLTAAVPVMAQEGAAPPPPPAQQPSARPSIESVMVTARKTEERAIDTPVALAVLTEAQMQRYATTDVTQLSSQLPGVEVNKASGGGAGGNFIIRGIGRQASDYGADQPVAFVLDGFSFTRGHMSSVGFFDVAAVEVLKGPQTLFFGKNSPAGVISVTSISPGDELEGFAKLSYEFRAEDPSVEFGVSIPVNEKLKIRVAGRGQFMQGGYYKNTSSDLVGVPRNLSPFETEALYPTNPNQFTETPKTKQYVGRITAVFTPNDNFDATLKIFAADSRDNDAGAAAVVACADGIGGHPYQSTGFFGDVADPTQTCDGKIRWRRHSTQPPQAWFESNPTLDDNDTHYYNHFRNFLTTLEMNWRVTDDLTLTSVSGYWDYKQRELTQYDYAYGVVASKQGEGGRSFTTELRLRSDFDGPVNFMIGGFYEDMKRDLDAPVQIFPLGPAPDSTFYPDFYNGSFLSYHQHWDNNITSWSVFAEMRWDITDTLELSGGVRYTEDNRNAHGAQLFNRLDQFFDLLGLPETANPFAHSGTEYDLTRSFHNTSPQATLSWKATPDILLYASYKTGYQAAGISNPGTIGNFYSLDSNGQIRFDGNGNPIRATSAEVNPILTFDGSTVKGFEIGAKGSFFGGMLTGDIALYHMKYSDLQVAVFNPVTTNFTVQNAAAAVNRGIEGNLYLQATDDLQLRLSAQYNHLKYKSFPEAQCYAGQADPTSATYRPELTGFCHPSASGTGLVQDMSGMRYGGGPFQVNAGFTYDVAVSNDWGLSLSGDVNYRNKSFETLRQPGTRVPSRTLINASLRLYQVDGPWEFSLICSNCGNDHYVYSIQDKPLGKTGDLTGQLGMPRLVTIQTTYRW